MIVIQDFLQVEPYKWRLNMIVEDSENNLIGFRTLENNVPLVCIIKTNHHMTTSLSTESQQNAMLVSLAVNAWNTQNSKVTRFVESLTDEQWFTATAPGRNRGIYLLGHLIAVADGLFPLFGLGNRLFPSYEKMFLADPDHAAGNIPAVAELRENWKQVIGNWMKNSRTLTSTIGSQGTTQFLKPTLLRSRIETN